jgi:2'-5' RNA ligase
MCLNKKARNPISYSIWLIPEGETYDILKSIIFELANTYTQIKFIPHVTLLSGFLGDPEELKIKSETLAQKISPFNLKFDSVRFFNEFFRSLFINIKSNYHLEDARYLAITEFIYSDSDFLPHLSLAYGNFDQKIFEKMKSLINTRLKKINGFYVNNIYLAHNDEINYKWNVIGDYKLK